MILKHELHPTGLSLRVVAVNLRPERVSEIFERATNWKISSQEIGLGRGKKFAIAFLQVMDWHLLHSRSFCRSYGCFA